LVEIFCHVKINRISLLMSFVNINYSTLEDAWGENFSRSKKHRPRKVEPDPICALYGKRYNKPPPPYARRRREDAKLAPSFETDEEYRKYYGYKDARVKAVYTAEIPNGYMTEEEECYEPKRKPPSKPRRATARAAPPSPAVYLEEETPYEPIDLQKTSPSAHEYVAPVPNSKDIDAYLSESEHEEEEEEYYPVVEEEKRVFEEERRPRSKLFQRVFEEEEHCNDSRSDIMRERMYLEIGLFTISGILMIFVMEQFIQIGMKLKPSNISA
jgi:hypothetical protein